MPPIFEGGSESPRPPWHKRASPAGRSAHRRRLAVLVSCHDSCPPSDPTMFENCGLYPTIGDSVRGSRLGAIALGLVDFTPRRRWGADSRARFWRGRAPDSASLRLGPPPTTYDRQHPDHSLRRHGRLALGPEPWRGPPAGRSPLFALVVRCDFGLHWTSTTPRFDYAVAFDVASASENLWAAPKRKYIALLAVVSDWPCTRGARLAP